MKTEKTSIALTLLLISLIVLLVVQALRLDDHLSTVEDQLLHRAPTAPPLQTLPGKLERAAIGQTVYVPVYSHIYRGYGQEQTLEVTLSIRNTDIDQAIVLHSIRYYGNEGTLLREYLEAPVRLGPLASTDFLVERRDMAGGVGANFLVEWAAEEVVTTPVIEAIMVNSEGNKAFAFARPGYVIESISTEAP